MVYCNLLFDPHSYLLQNRARLKNDLAFVDVERCADSVAPCRDGKTAALRVLKLDRYKPDFACRKERQTNQKKSIFIASRSRTWKRPICLSCWMPCGLPM